MGPARTPALIRTPWAIYSGHGGRRGGVCVWVLVFPLLVVGDVGEDPHGSGQDSSTNQNPVGHLLSKGDTGPGRTRDPGLVREHSHALASGNSSGQVQGHSDFSCRSESSNISL